MTPNPEEIRDATFQDRFVCFQLRVPPAAEQEAIRNALQENSRNGVLSARPATNLNGDYSSPELINNEPSALVVNIRKYWSAGRTLKIRFLEGDESLKARVKKFASIWLQYANIKFQWLDKDNPQDADIRITFVQGGGSWSYVGIDCYQIVDQKKATMNYGWLRPTSTDEQVREVVLHEFGHALGCEHEHQSPLANLDWNEEVIYLEMSLPPNSWSRASTKFNIIDPVKADNVRASSFDRESIMLYEYPSSWFKNKEHQGTPRNTKLSQTDINWIKTNYPAYPTDVGQFSTLQVRPWNNSGEGTDSMEAQFTPPYRIPPSLAIGLTWLDVDYREDLSVSASADDVFEESFTIRISHGPKAQLYSAACSWLEVSKDTDEIETGSVNISLGKTGDGKSNPEMSQWVKYGSEFNGPDAPVVVCWLNSFNMDKDSPWRVKVFPTNVGLVRFKLNVEASPDTLVQSVGVTWVAFPKDKDGIAGGSFSTERTAELQHQHAGITSFPPGAFLETPQLMMAISGFDYEPGHNLRLRLSSSNVTKDGLSWNLDSWLDSQMNSATGAYVAIAPPKNIKKDAGLIRDEIKKK